MHTAAAGFNIILGMALWLGGQPSLSKFFWYKHMSNDSGGGGEVHRHNILQGYFFKVTNQLKWSHNMYSGTHPQNLIRT